MTNFYEVWARFSVPANSADEAVEIVETAILEDVSHLIPNYEVIRPEGDDLERWLQQRIGPETS